MFNDVIDGTSFGQAFKALLIDHDVKFRQVPAAPACNSLLSDLVSKLDLVFRSFWKGDYLFDM
jgi:hypothetical protein